MKNLQLRLSIGVISTVLFSTFSSAYASFVFNVTQVGPNVVVTGSGTLNVSSLTLLGSSAYYAQIEAQGPNFFGGPTLLTPDQSYTSVSGPLNLGGGTFLSPQGATSGSGSLVGISGGFLEVPNGYVSGNPLSDSDIYNAPSFAALNLIPGSYVYTWGSGPTADSLTINIGTVPEPASLAMVGIPAALAMLRRRRVR